MDVEAVAAAGLLDGEIDLLGRPAADRADAMGRVDRISKKDCLVGVQRCARTAEAQAVQARFFDTFLKDIDTGLAAEPRVRLEIRSSGSNIAEIRPVLDWPPAGTVFTDWFLTGDGSLSDSGDGAETALPFRTDGAGLRFRRTAL